MFKRNTTLPGNLHIQCNSCQVTSGIYHRTKPIFFLNVYRNTKGPEEPEQS